MTVYQRVATLCADAVRSLEDARQLADDVHDLKNASVHLVHSLQCLANAIHSIPPPVARPPLPPKLHD